MSFEIMINNCYGGFGFSKEAIDLYKKRKNIYKSHIHVDRTDEIMIQIVKELGENANGNFCKIKIEKIDKDYKKCYYIDEYDGLENIQIDYFKKNLIDIIKSNLDAETKLIKIQEYFDL